MYIPHEPKDMKVKIKLQVLKWCSFYDQLNELCLERNCDILSYKTISGWSLYNTIQAEIIGSERNTRLLANDIQDLV